MRKPVSSPVGTGAARLGRASDERTSRTALASSLSPVPKPKKQSKAAKQRTEFERKYGTPEFQAHLHASPCLGCATRLYIDQAHFGKHGMSKKNDWTRTGPMCRPQHGAVGCHDRYDRRSSAPTWFTAMERKMIEVRQRVFVAAWLASSPQQDNAQ